MCGNAPKSDDGLKRSSRQKRAPNWYKIDCIYVCELLCPIFHEAINHYQE